MFKLTVHDIHTNNSSVMHLMDSSIISNSPVTRDANLIDFMTIPSSQLREGVATPSDAHVMSMPPVDPSPVQPSGAQMMDQTTCNSLCNSQLSTCNSQRNPQLSTYQYVMQRKRVVA